MTQAIGVHAQALSSDCRLFSFPMKIYPALHRPLRRLINMRVNLVDSPMAYETLWLLFGYSARLVTLRVTDSRRLLCGNREQVTH